MKFDHTKLTAMLNQRNVTARDLAHEMGVSHSTAANWTNGTFSPGRHLSKIASYLECTEDDLKSEGRTTSRGDVLVEQTSGKQITITDVQSYTLETAFGHQSVTVHTTDGGKIAFSHIKSFKVVDGFFEAFAR